ncbi:MAG: hypothetical protein Q4E54_06875 [Lachnospiraceae bacterium]|nr:hypothetical protein [Lachnospiraceae bacterium]
MILDVKKIKIAVMVPEENLEDVRIAMCEAGCGHIGNYTHCTMATKITGTFMGNDKTNQYIGSKNVIESRKEIKLEALCSIENAEAVLAAIRRAHPYEESGIDIYPMIDEEDLRK